MSNPYDNFDPDTEAESIRAPEPEPIDMDRGEPTTKAPKKKKHGVILLVLAIVLGSVIAVGFFIMFFLRAVSSDDSAAAVVEPDAAMTRQASTGPDLGAFQRRIEQQLAEQREREARAQREQQSTPQQPAPQVAEAQTGGAPPSLGRYEGRPSSSSRTRSNNKDEMTPEEIAEARRFQPGVLWGDMPSTGADPRYSNTAAGGQQQNQPQQTIAGGGDGLGGLLKTEAMAEGYAVGRPDLKYLLKSGTTIPCTLIPRIVTNYPGHTSCLVNRDVYSANGEVLLIEKGSTALGERKVSIKPGDVKVFVVWGTIETPHGVKIGIDSMAADQLGAAGLDAVVDNHYGKRFGAAILLSVLDDALQYVVEESRRGDGVTFDSSTNNAEDMASIALENTINIQPTGYVQHASETNIIVARDVDFRSVYGVR